MYVCVEYDEHITRVVSKVPKYLLRTYHSLVLQRIANASHVKPTKVHNNEWSRQFSRHVVMKHCASSLKRLDHCISIVRAIVGWEPTAAVTFLRQVMHGVDALEILDVDISKIRGTRWR